MICSQGDMAFVIKAIRPANIGRVVTVSSMLGYYIQGESVVWNGEIYKAIITDHYWVISGNLETQYGRSAQAFAPDTWLKPIKGDLTDDTTETNKELETV